MQIEIKSAKQLMDDLYQDSKKYGITLNPSYEKLFRDKCEQIGSKLYDVIEEIPTKEDGLTLYKIYDNLQSKYTVVSSKDIVKVVCNND